ncbi:efflux RND transporter periplasmic adaptor subunit [candidate division GN15 bacterium]|uniref:Efflux RND transporter periplasmic adaptor subunit n=1 Tax=candidate division GN15 bacterium TaxID=2072418 RepID=A0A855WZY2_9BACT|nr:MAG: efflux RND transporter periplasmic adaptor subunit [candidate division GN15 bacterium]
MNKKLIWWLVIAIIVVAAGSIYWLKREKSQEITYRFEKIDRGDLSVAISATGTLSAVTTVQVGTQVSGTIAKLYADFNSVVKEGQLLAQLDPTFLQAAVNVQRANVDRAKAQLQESQRNFDRTKELLAKSMVSQADMDAATTDLQSAQASLRQNQASLDQAEVNLKYATITAPISGVVISRNVDVGQTVAANFSAPTLFTIANDLRNMQVQASVDEADVGQVKVGQPVSFRVDAYPDDEFHGSVSQVRLEPVISQNVVTYNVIIDVNNPELKLMPGMTATASIEVARRDDALRVPLLALRFTPTDSAALRAAAATDGAGRRRPHGADSTGVGEERRSPDSTAAPGERQHRDSTDHRPQRREGGAFAAEREASDEMNQPKPAGTPARAWTIVDGQLKPVRIIRGIQTTRYAEVLWSDLKPGDSVIVGSNGGSNGQQSQVTGQNPFMPRFGGGGRH